MKIPLKQLIEEWKKDSEIDNFDLAEALRRVPILHSKYLSQIIFHRIAAEECRHEIAKLTKIKWEYYTGKYDTPQKLKDVGWPPFQYKLLKPADINTYLEADTDLIELNKKLVYNKEAIYFCEEAIKHINSMSYEIRDIMNWRKFSAGERG